MPVNYIPNTNVTIADMMTIRSKYQNAEVSPEQDCRNLWLKIKDFFTNRNSTAIVSALLRNRTAMDAGNEDGLASFVDLYHAVSSRLRPGVSLQLIQQNEAGNNQLVLTLGNYILGKTQIKSGSALQHILEASNVKVTTPEDQHKLIGSVMELLWQVSELQASDEHSCTTRRILDLHLSYNKVVEYMIKTDIMFGVPRSVGNGLYLNYDALAEHNGRSGVLKMTFDGIPLFETGVRLTDRNPGLFYKTTPKANDSSLYYANMRSYCQEQHVDTLSFGMGSNSAGSGIPAAGSNSTRLCVSDLEANITTGENQKLEYIPEYNNPMFISAWMSLSDRLLSSYCSEDEYCHDYLLLNDSSETIISALPKLDEVRLRSKCSPQLSTTFQGGVALTGASPSIYSGSSLVIARACEIYTDTIAPKFGTNDRDGALGFIRKAMLEPANSALGRVAAQKNNKQGIPVSETGTDSDHVNAFVTKHPDGIKLFEEAKVEEVDYLAYSVLAAWFSQRATVPALDNMASQVTGHNPG